MRSSASKMPAASSGRQPRPTRSVPVHVLFRKTGPHFCGTLEHVPLIPAHARIQIFLSLALDPRFRGDERDGADSIASEYALAAASAAPASATTTAPATATTAA